MFKRIVVIASMLAVATIAVSLRAADDPLVGTWKLNIAKSKYSAGYPIPKSQIYKFEANGPDGFKYTNDTEEADGSKVHAEYSVKLDGKDYPVKGDPNRDATSQKRVDAYTTTTVSKLAGKVVSETTRRVSKDGKTFTNSTKGTRGGKAYENIVVYDRQ